MWIIHARPAKQNYLMKTKPASYWDVKPHTWKWGATAHEAEMLYLSTFKGDVVVKVEGSPEPDQIGVKTLWSEN